MTVSAKNVTLFQKFDAVLLAIKIAVITALMIAVPAAKAHEIQPLIASVSFSSASDFTLEIEGNLEALIAEIGPEHEDTDVSPAAEKYNELRSLAPDALSETFTQFVPTLMPQINLQSNGASVALTFAEAQIPEVGDIDLARLSTAKFVGSVPAGAETFAVQLTPALGDFVVRLVNAEADEVTFSDYVAAGQASPEISISGVTETDIVATIIDYLVIGFTHIVPKGLDHILFVIGIYLASTRLAPLLWQVSAFTLAHTVTLALGILGLVNIPGSIVEPLIALSIAYICVENIIFKKMTAWRPLIIFGFGLLHGLGFAGVLSEIGLPPQDFIVGLISFNVGVEIGQLFVIALCFAFVGIWFRHKDFYRKLIVIPGSLVIGAVGLYWFVERIGLI